MVNGEGIGFNYEQRMQQIKEYSLNCFKLKANEEFIIIQPEQQHNSYPFIYTLKFPSFHATPNNNNELCLSIDNFIQIVVNNFIGYASHMFDFNIEHYHEISDQQQDKTSIIIEFLAKRIF